MPVSACFVSMDSGSGFRQLLYTNAVSGRFETWSDSPRPCFGGGGAWPGGGWSVPALVQRGGGRFWPLSSYTVHCTVYSTVPLYITVNGGEGRGGESIYIKA